MGWGSVRKISFGLSAWIGNERNNNTYSFSYSLTTHIHRQMKNWIYVQHTFSRCRLDGTYESYFICLFNNTSIVRYSTYSPVSCSVLIHWTLTLWKSDEIDIIINVTFTITTNMYWLMQVEWRKIRFDFYIVINKSNSSISL